MAHYLTSWYIILFIVGITPNPPTNIVPTNIA